MREERKKIDNMFELFREDPTSVFAVKVKLPSGNELSGTVGPMINGKVIMGLGFRDEPTEEDLKLGRAAADRMMGKPAAIVRITETEEEMKQARTEMRRFMGGGQG